MINLRLQMQQVICALCEICWAYQSAMHAEWNLCPQESML